MNTPIIDFKLTKALLKAISDSGDIRKASEKLAVPVSVFLNSQFMGLSYEEFGKLTKRFNIDLTKNFGITAKVDFPEFEDTMESKEGAIFGYKRLFYNFLIHFSIFTKDISQGERSDLLDSILSFSA
jgi:hypothetical protein